MLSAALVLYLTQMERCEQARLAHDEQLEDAILDEMDHSWNKMTPEDLQQLNAILFPKSSPVVPGPSLLLASDTPSSSTAEHPANPTAPAPILWIFRFDWTSIPIKAGHQGKS